MFRRLIPSTITPDQQKAWDRAGPVGHMLETGRPLDFDTILRATQTYCDHYPDANSPGVCKVLEDLATLIDYGFAEYVGAGGEERGEEAQGDCEFRVASGCGLRVEDYGYDECDQWETAPDECWRFLSHNLKALRHVFDQWEERGFKLDGRDCATCGRQLLAYRGGDTICPECNRHGRDKDAATIHTLAKDVADLSTGYSDLVLAVRAYFREHGQEPELSAVGAWLGVQLGAADELLNRDED